MTAPGELGRPVARPGSVARPASVDVILRGTVFRDLIFSGLGEPPGLGRELRSSGFGASPGGVANIAIALRRLGLTVGLAAAFSDDADGVDLWRELEASGVDLATSVRCPGWPTPLTVSMVYDGDRSMVTYERPAPIVPTAPDDQLTARAAVAFLGHETPDWLGPARAAGALVVADVGWDETGHWAPGDLAGLAECDVFAPNAGEAMAYSRTDTPEAAAEALARLVPLVVVKCGADGSIACRSGERAPIHEPPIEVEVVDPTGAGDVFDAALVYGVLAGWPVRHVLRFGNLCAGLSVRQHGGSRSSPHLDEVQEWVHARPGDAERYRFLAELPGREGRADAGAATSVDHQAGGARS